MPSGPLDVHQTLRTTRSLISERKFEEALQLVLNIDISQAETSQAESALSCIAECYEGLDQVEPAAEAWQQAVAMKLGHEELSPAVRMYYRLGNAYRRQRNLVLARLYWERAAHWMKVALSTPVTERVRLLSNLGRAHLQLGDLEIALRYYQDAKAAAAPAVSGLDMAVIEHGLGHVLLELGRYDEAQNLIESALKKYDAENHDRGVNQCRINLAVIDIRRGEYERAIVLLDHCLEDLRFRSDRLRTANAFCMRAVAELQRNRRDAAAQDALQAITTSREPTIQATAHEVLALCAKHSDPQAAVAEASEAVRATQSLSNIVALVEAKALLRESHVQSGRGQEALSDAFAIAATAVHYVRCPHSFTRVFPDK